MLRRSLLNSNYWRLHSYRYIARQRRYASSVPPPQGLGSQVTDILNGQAAAAAEGAVSRQFVDIWEAAHNLTHLPWFWTLPAVALLTRLGIYYSMTRPAKRTVQKMADVRNVIHARVLAVQGPDPDMAWIRNQRATEIARQTKMCFEAWKVKPARRLLPLLQIFPFLVLMEGLRGVLGYQEGFIGVVTRIFKGKFTRDSSAEASGSIDSTTNADILPATQHLFEGTKVSNAHVTPSIDSATTMPSPDPLGLTHPIDAELLSAGPFGMDLTAVDSTGVLAGIVPAVMLINVLWSAGILRREKTFEQLGPFSRALLVLPIPMFLIALQLPAGMLWFWFWSSSFGLASQIYSDLKHPLHIQGGKGFKPLRRPFRGPRYEENV